MRKVKNSRPEGEKGKKEKIMRREPGKYKGEKARTMEVGDEESRQKDSAK